MYLDHSGSLHECICTVLTFFFFLVRRKALLLQPSFCCERNQRIPTVLIIYRRILFQASNALEELCFMIMGMLPKPQEQDEKDNTKRFLFHYSKTQKLGKSNVVSSVVHPLLQLVPHLHERRMKRFRVDEEFQSPFASQSRGYFLFRPRNGRRSAGFI
ncbi:neuromedin-U isoform X1 [Homo sapiens]|uniref:neuromedin-U isoform X1 n=1 Tax=Homo sapiens TaxID=9606 RepID=UPI0005D03700|nr:neuromedin-U isoform X1 [Homo sapiens]XP_054204774.1 neuromedin-U isoform X1 [Homo sapiens]|eukprot:XP_011532669.1 neuromedin-U isoform X1 [Homo sapiens]